MKSADLGAIIVYEDKLVEVVAISDKKSLLLRPIGADPCPTCKRLPDIHIIEASPLFQDNASAVKTLVGGAS